MGALPANPSSAVCSGFWLFSAWPSFPWASLNLKQRQLPIQRLTRIFCMEVTMDLDIMGATTATLATATTERDLLTPSLFLLLMLMPRLKQTPGTDTMDTVLVTMVLGTMATMAIPTYGKRSADAEPVSAPDADAKADPYLLYGYYGLGHGYYGGYGYGYGYPYYGGYYYGK